MGTTVHTLTTGEHHLVFGGPSTCGEESGTRSVLPISAACDTLIDVNPAHVLSVQPAPDLRRFLALATEWRQDVAALSSESQRLAHPACREIVGLGFGVVPLILAQLEHDPWHWGGVLAEITGARPVPPAAAGRLDRVAAAWLDWARANGIRW